MLIELAKDIYLVKLPMPVDMGSVNSYLVKENEGYTLIDTGDNTNKVKEIWQQLIDDGVKITKILLTHVHPDHVGSVNWLQKQFDLEVMMSDKSYDELVYMKNQFVDGVLEEFTRLEIFLSHGGPKIQTRHQEYSAYEIFDFEPTIIFKEDEIIKVGKYNFQAIWTPGHSYDHFCFYDKDEGILVAGDHVLKEINPIIIPEKVGDNPLGRYFESLDKIVDLPVKLTLSGHGGVIEDLPARITAMKERYIMRFNEIIDYIGDKTETAFDVSRYIYRDNFAPPVITQTISNLTFLEGKGIFTSEKNEDIIYFKKKTAIANVDMSLLNS